MLKWVVIGCQRAPCVQNGVTSGTIVSWRQFFNVLCGRHLWSDGATYLFRSRDLTISHTDVDTLISIIHKTYLNIFSFVTSYDGKIIKSKLIVCFSKPKIKEISFILRSMDAGD